MSAVTLQPAARRRANFVGGIHTSTSDHDGSYQHLRAELGEENTNRLITNIGTLAMTSGIAASGVSLSDAVKRIIGSLTPAERSAIASGAAPPPRVQALLDSEVKAALQQRQMQTTAANATSEDGTQSRNGLTPAAFAAMDRELRGRTSRSTEYSDLRSDSISSANYSSSEYARTGLNFTTFSDLRNQGFNGQQIMAAVNTTRSLGIDTNRNAAPMARVQRDIPNAVPGLHTTHQNWSDVKKLEDEQRKALEAGNTAAAEAVAARIAEARRKAEEHDRHERERVQRERPDRAGDHEHLQGEVRRSALGHEAKAGVRNDSRPTDYSDQLTRKQDQAVTLVTRRAEAATSSEPQRQQTRAAGDAMFGPSPQAAPQPIRQASAETPPPPTPPANPPAAAPVKTADATPPARQQPTPPRMASPAVRS